MSRKKITVLEWLNTIGYASDNIKTTVKFGMKTVCTGQSPQWLASHGSVGALEAKVTFVTITCEEITIQAKPKDFTI